jgi:hypothetical protein
MHTTIPTSEYSSNMPPCKCVYGNLDMLDLYVVHKLYRIPVPSPCSVDRVQQVQKVQTWDTHASALPTLKPFPLLTATGSPYEIWGLEESKNSSQSE